LTAMIPHMPANHSFFHTIPRRDPNPAIPSLRQLQSALENSWKAGFDPIGARHFKHKVVGRASKIGAVEVSSVLAYCGVDSTVVQFIKCRESREMLPRFIRAYFSKSVGTDGCPFCAKSQLQSVFCAKALLELADSGIQFIPACECPSFPLYLQWEGHSVSIIGISTDNSVLVLDPMKDGKQMKSDLQKGKIPHYLRIPSKSLTGKDTQIVMCSFRCLTHREKEKRMEEPSAVTAAVEAVERVLLLEKQRRR
jgi:Peptidase family C78